MPSVTPPTPSNWMLIFVGTDFPGGRQFHLHLPVSASLAELKQAIWASATSRESISPSDQYIQHASLPVSPILPLHNQGITSFSCVHLHHLAHLRRLEAEKAAAAVRDEAERGRYIDKAGRWKLRRRSRRKGQGQGHRHDRVNSAAGRLALPGFETLLTSGHERAVSVGTASPSSAHSWDLRGWTPP